MVFYAYGFIKIQKLKNFRNEKMHRSNKTFHVGNMEKADIENNNKNNA